MRELVIWAHSECRSTMALFREVKRQAGVPVTIALWKCGEADDVRKARELTGQMPGEYAGLGLIPVGEDFNKGLSLLSKHGDAGAVHVFCVYQNSPVWRRLILKAKDMGLRTVVYAESPCEMCTGAKALAKRFYYRFLLPFMIRKVANAADVFLNQSGEKGTGRLLRIGWAKEKIVPFGYASAVDFGRVECAQRAGGGFLRILHSGSEAKYRGVATLLKAVDVLRMRGVAVDLVRTCGTAGIDELRKLYAWADVFVACGLCEPWGMRVNDAIHAGLPVVVSSGMGAKMIVEQHACGSVYRAGDVKALADALQRFAEDRSFVEHCRDRVAKAHEAWSPENKAKEFIRLISE